LRGNHAPARGLFKKIKRSSNLLRIRTDSDRPLRGAMTASTADPFLERLQAHAQAIRERPPVAPPRPVAATAPRPDQLAFWQSPIVRAAINRRVSGDPAVAPELYLAQRHAPAVPAPQALSLRASDVRLEAALVENELCKCQGVTGLDGEDARAQSANAGVPKALRQCIRFQQGDLSTFEPPEPLGAVISRSFLHRQGDLDAAIDRIGAILAPGGLVFVDEFVGPARFQWTDAQLHAINRLLARLSDELLVDLSARDGRHKRSVERPNVDAAAAANPHDAVCSDRIVAALDARLQRVEVSLYGGAIYHQLFTRIMGNFTSQPELVSVLMECDALLTDAGVVASDYVWGVWRKP
jgi:SAM-dependent methyltransferase